MLTYEEKQLAEGPKNSSQHARNRTEKWAYSAGMKTELSSLDDSAKFLDFFSTATVDDKYIII